MIRSCPEPASITPASPVATHPSASLVAAVASGSRKYSTKTPGERYETSPFSAILISTPGLGTPTVSALTSPSGCWVMKTLASVCP